MENKELNSQNPQEATDLIAKLQANRKKIITAGCALAAAIIVGLAWYYISESNSNKAAEAAGEADYAMFVEGNDSVAVELYKKAAEMGYDSGSRANVMLAISAYQKGNYEEALTYLENASMDDEVIASGVCSLKGDCLVNLQKLDEALEAYDEAISTANGNPLTAGLFLVKKANIYREKGEFAKEYEAYKTIFDRYPEFTTSTQVDLQKYLERAKAAAGK